MSHAKNKIKWCLSKAEKELKEGKKHRGLIKIEPSISEARAHISKAEHNLKVTFYLYKGRFTDWCSSSLFYTIYHCFLAILSKFEYESRNQECTFALIANLIETGKINIDKKDLEKVCSLSTAEIQGTALSIREKYQYSTKVSLEDKEYNDLLQLAKRILDVAKEVIAGNF